MTNYHTDPHRVDTHQPAQKGQGYKTIVSLHENWPDGNRNVIMHVIK